MPRQSVTGFDPQAVFLILSRDKVACARCGVSVAGWERGYGWSIHHRRPRGSGGTSLAWVDAPANGIVLCGSGTTGCHGWVESHRTASISQGFLVSMNGRMRADQVPIMHALYGLVLLDDDGGFTPVEGGP